MIISTGFHYNGEYSGHKNVTKIRTSSGLITDSFLASVDNKVVKTRNSRKSHIQNVERESLVIPMALYFDNNLDDVTIRAIKKWLNQDDFKELIFEDQPNRVYYAKLNGVSDLSHNNISSGYVEFEFLTNSEYVYSPLVELEGESDSATEFTSLLLNNNGDVPVFPKIKIFMNPNNATDIEIYNDTTGEYLLIQNNLVDEIIVVWNEYEEFETSSIIRHVYDDHNGGFISFAEGLNELRIRGIFSYIIEYQDIYL